MIALNRWKTTLVTHFQEHQSTYLFTSILLLMGVIFGAVIVNSLHVSHRNDLYVYLNQFFSYMTEDEWASSSAMFSQSFTHYVKTFGLMWLLGLTVIGIPVILILLFLKGVVVGFTVGFLVKQMGIDGFIFALTSVFPQNVILIPTYLVVTSVALAFSLKLWRQLVFRGRESMPQAFISYSSFFIIIIALVATVAAYEGYVSPFFMRWVVSVM
ncbi:stage II sporulation protein M [Texcoconibacillus texcoconensis]|uniref:Stage II sporulation protein M n=1 Tax=Texcoconibacillus texcoconensis TaxID=1095777 RepID=A0A840QNS6_9BACI|nr:stage II sporulation protein M [Texcoconibacillus texcoconensis]MBB5172991.1 stage II sporulation protein M [Texcoconibacillus texcoconensis]